MQQIMHESIQVLLVPVTVLGSVLLVCSCLFFKRFRKKNRNASGSVPDKNKSGKTRECDANSKVKGITNTAFTVDGNAGIYENDVNVYDYAKIERSKETKSGHQSKSNGLGQDTRSSDLSPMYDHVTDTETRFYFTLEKCPPERAGITDGCAGNPGYSGEDEDTYVIAIPENIYDNPEGTEDDVIAEAEVQGASQFYHTLEEYTEQNEKNISPHVEPEESVQSRGDICDTADGDDRIQQEEDDIAAVDVQGASQFYHTLEESRSRSGGATYDTADGDYRNQQDISIEMEEEYQMQTGDEDTYVINIPNEVHGVKNKPPIKFADRGHAENTEKQEEATVEEYVVNISNDFDFQKVSPNIKGKGFPRRMDKEVDETEGNSRSVKIEKSMKEFWKNKAIEEGKENDNDDDDGYVISASEANDENNGHFDETIYNDQFDEAIYENWENNIVGRTRNVSGESGDDIYLNETFDIMNEQDQDSGRGSFYQNLTEFRQSLVLLDAR